MLNGPLRVCVMVRVNLHLASFVLKLGPLFVVARQAAITPAASILVASGTQVSAIATVAVGSIVVDLLSLRNLERPV